MKNGWKICGEKLSGNCNLLYGYHALAPREENRVDRVTIKVIIMFCHLSTQKHFQLHLPIYLIHCLA